ncbi:Holliday junction branch migration protein RuvA [Lentilactobacillus sp. IMAU92037]|uniref:Holliday junction branch migration protein RuvA n=1 Tax=Lentilactobacillus TaxID=2767893 RepID=UPI001C252C6B|nr:MULTISPECIES: Holliday junction branch migration protein RuvA [Lentilactobacillus]MBU9788099.1 Holliday junction branch migration protein RuvA [Lentilactobacillus dabitei]MBV0930026.1 Holliday junction branch migration protein RuvA [Lentilactobacillus dabitei]MDM7516213.1 Holliday junction branch migration protein RuvA [Lentilactobacillus sp. TOM.63]
MFEFFDGYVVDIKPTHIVLLVGGVGYLVYAADPFQFKVDSKTAVRVYVYQSVSDSAILLYGFHDIEDKQLFEKLIAVSGIGPKSALAILAGNDRDGLVAAVKSKDVKFLTKFPGVGKKTAQQIILDLQDKLNDIATDGMIPQEKSSAAPQSQELTDALSALQALGYGAKQVDGIENDLAAKTGLSTDEYLSMGLKLLMH